jgi:hypothetical protein
MAVQNFIKHDQRDLKGSKTKSLNRYPCKDKPLKGFLEISSPPSPRICYKKTVLAVTEKSALFNWHRVKIALWNDSRHSYLFQQ